MQTIRPLTRTARSTIIPSTSRIPHISWHIRCKNKRPRRSDLCQTSTIQHRRFQSTLLHASDFNAHFSTEEQERSSSTTHGPPSDGAKSTPPSQRASCFSTTSITAPIESEDAIYDTISDLDSSVEQAIETRELLNEANPERILSWLEYHPTGRAFITAASDEDFEKAFCAVDPHVLLEQFKEALWYSRGQGVGGSELYLEKSLVTLGRSFAQTVDDILMARQNVGLNLTLPICRHALQCAALIGNVRMANHIWKVLLPLCKGQADIACYNAYMDAHAWNLGFSQPARQSYRASQRNLSLRSQAQRPKHLWGYSAEVKDREGRKGNPGLKSNALALFQEISDKGLSPTEETFTTLMISLARTGDINGAESILKSVWNIDVNLLDAFDEEEIQSPTFYAEDHPLRPTSKLLWTVVHCYGITSNGTKAWSLLDYISRNYALEIPPRVWNELIERTYVLSRRWAASRRKQGQADGHLPPTEVERLYQTLIDEPYNQSPTPIISDLLARSYRGRKMMKKTIDQLKEMDRTFRDHIQTLSFLNEAFRDLSQHVPALLNNGILSTSFLELRRKFQMNYLDVRLRLDLLTRQVHRTTKGGDFAGRSWDRIELPLFIEHMHQYVPNQVRYYTRTGEVTLKLRTSKETLNLEKEIYNVIREGHVIWNALNTNNLFEVASNLRNLPNTLNVSKTSTLEHPRPQDIGGFSPFSEIQERPNNG